MPPRHRFLEPIHNVKKDANSAHIRELAPAKPVVFIPGKIREQRVAKLARPTGRRALLARAKRANARARRLRGEQTIHLRVSEDGGAYRDRTDDLMLAKQPLSQLS